MFDFFASKNQKLVKKWHKEHEEIVVVAHKIIGAYSMNNQAEAKKYLKQLDKLVVGHVMDEDIELFRLTHNNEKIDPETEKLVKDFIQSFKETKLALIDFLSRYTKEDVQLDETFIKQFNNIVETVVSRIEFEEKNVYSKLKEK